MPTVLSASVREPYYSHRAIRPSRTRPWTRTATHTVSVTDPLGGQVIRRDSVNPAPFNQNAHSYTLQGRSSVRKKSKKSGFSVCDFGCFAYLYIASDEPNKKLATRRGCSYGLQSAY